MTTPTTTTAPVRYEIDPERTFYIDYRLAGHWLPALIDGDISNLDSTEAEQLDKWEKRQTRLAQEAGAAVWHWGHDPADRCFSPDAVTGLMADCYAVQLVLLYQRAVGDAEHPNMPEPTKVPDHVTGSEIMAALEDLEREVGRLKLNVRKDYSLMVAQAAAIKIIMEAKGHVTEGAVVL